MAASPSPAPTPIDLVSLLVLLQEGSIEIQGLLPYGSNYTFLTTVKHRQQTTLAVYKPTRGEQPLWDFPENTLAFREVAAFLVSEALGWQLVPPTVYRTEGPHGAGSVQFFVQAQPDVHYFTLAEADQPDLQRVALFDLLVNNADRKGGHVLKDYANKVWIIDHGICFNAQPKLRTVIWDFGGQPIPKELLEDVTRFRAELESQTALHAGLGQLLDASEIGALRRRTDRLLATKHYPEPGPGRNYPWPPL